MLPVESRDSNEVNERLITIMLDASGYASGVLAWFPDFLIGQSASKLSSKLLTSQLNLEAASKVGIVCLRL